MFNCCVVVVINFIKMSYKILQWNCSNHDNFDESYLEQALENIDVCLLQRCKNNFLSLIQNKFNNVFHIKHSIHRSLVIGTNHKFDDQKYFQLPTFDRLLTSDDPNQGSLAQSVSINGTQIINFQIAYEDDTITRNDTYDDFKYIFENAIEYENCVIGGDIHYEPDTPENFEHLIKQHNFKNNTNNIVTFSKIKNGVAHGFRHDRILTKGNINVHNIQTFARSHVDGNAHWIITYNV